MLRARGWRRQCEQHAGGAAVAASHAQGLLLQEEEEETTDGGEQDGGHNEGVEGEDNEGGAGQPSVFVGLGQVRVLLVQQREQCDDEGVGNGLRGAAIVSAETTAAVRS